MEGSITLYEMAKQMVAIEKQMDMICLNKKFIELAKKMINKKEYYMLICPDNRQYVVFHINNSTTTEKIKDNLLEVLLNRGSVLLVDEEKNDIVEFWLKDKFTDNIYMYQLIPYEVVEV